MQKKSVGLLVILVLLLGLMLVACGGGDEPAAEGEAGGGESAGGDCSSDEVLCVGLVTDVGEAAKMIGNGKCGRVVDREDPEALARSISELASSPKLRESLGASAREEAKNYTEDRMLEKLFREYDQLLN